MIAMQYSLVLPADYDMGIIGRRIDERAHLTDGFPGLAFKAYLQANRREAPRRTDNLYAPFYLWRDADGMNDFLCGPGFDGLTQSFGRPSVSTWSVWHAALAPDIAGARHALRQTLPIAPHTDLATLRREESERSRAWLSDGDVLATVAGFVPSSWSVVRFLLLRAMPHVQQLQQPGQPWAEGQVQCYGVGHVSTG